MQLLWKNVICCQKNFQKWNKSQLQHQLTVLHDKLHNIGDTPRDDQSIHTDQQLVDNIKELCSREDILWRQTSRVEWLQEGDSNTHYFHLRASARNMWDKISMLVTDAGNILTDMFDIERKIFSYFSDLFKAGTSLDDSNVEHAMEYRITQDDNDMLPYFLNLR